MGELVDRDLEHLRLLKISYYILAGTAGFVVLFSLFYLGMGGLFLSGVLPRNPNSSDDPRVVGLIFLSIGIAIFLFGLILCSINYWTGRSLKDRRHRTFCLVSACLSFLNIPFGTAIGVCTIIVLNRPGVRALFEGPPTV